MQSCYTSLFNLHILFIKGRYKRHDYSQNDKYNITVIQIYIMKMVLILEIHVTGFEIHAYVCISDEDIFETGLIHF